MGSIAPFDITKNPLDVQLFIWVGSPYQNKGIGTRIVATLEWYVFEVWGFPRLFYFHELTNRASERLSKKSGYQKYDPYMIQYPNYVNKYPVLWCTWVKYRNPSLAPGIFQGIPIEKFTEVRHKAQRNLLGLPRNGLGGV